MGVRCGRGDDDHQTGGEAEGDARGDQQQTREHPHRIAGSFRSVGEPQLTGRKDREADDEAPSSTPQAQDPRQQGERDDEAGQGCGHHRQSTGPGEHGQRSLEVERDEHERRSADRSAEDGERRPRCRRPGAEQIQRDQWFGRATLRTDEQGHERDRQAHADQDELRPPAVREAERAVDGRHDRPRNGHRTAQVEAAGDTSLAVVEDAPRHDHTQQ